MKIKFRQYTESKSHPDSLISECGNFHIVKYDGGKPCETLGTKFAYAAYYRLSCGQFGDYVNDDTPFYKTLAEAKNACSDYASKKQKEKSTAKFF